MSQVSKTGDTAILQINGITDADFGVYSCRAVNIRGTALKEFTLVKAGECLIVWVRYFRENGLFPISFSRPFAITVDFASVTFVWFRLFYLA